MINSNSVKKCRCFLKKNLLKNNNILFIHTGKSTFVNQDIDLLSKHFSLKIHHYSPSKKIWPNLREQFKLLFTLTRWISRAHTIFIWFADYHSFLPVLFARLLGKHSIIVLGGYDVTYIPEIRYGSFSNPLRSLFTSISLKYSDYLLPVDASLIKFAKRRIQLTHTKIVEIPTGYNGEDWYCDTKKESLVLTVSLCKSMQMVKRKGIDFLIEVAKLIPDIKFIIVGVNPKLISQLHYSPNVTFKEKMDIETLRREYSRAKVYAQFSLHEGLPNVLCEAMLCECIPVGSNVCGIPTAIDGCGYLLNNRDIESARNLILKALKSPVEQGKKARKHILKNFPISRREEALIKILSRQ